MSEQSIYVGLRNGGLTHAGACAMIGNMYAESTMKSNIAQRGMTKLTDEEYTIEFDADPESCYRDGVGYGLCQWTYFSRKIALRQFASNWGVSVGTEDMQVAFALYELQTDNAGLFQFLCETNDMYKATERICKEFERPAVNNVATRYAFAEKYFEQFNDVISDKAATEFASVAKPWEHIIIYALQIGGYDTTSPVQALKQYIKDIGG